MICLTTLPVMTVTWIATKNTINSVEKEIISANNSRMMWADQYLSELIQQIDLMFYSLQLNQQLMNSLTEDSKDIGVQLKTNKYIRDTLNSAFYANSRKVDDLTLYNHSGMKAFLTSYVNTGTKFSLDIQSGSWSRLLDEPIKMYFKQSGNGINAFHGIYRFPDQKLLGGISVRINTEVWKEVGNILKSEADSLVFFINDEGEMLSGSNAIGESSEILEQLGNMKLEKSNSEFHKTENFFYFMKRVEDGELMVVKVIPIETVTNSARATVTAGLLTGSIFAAISILLSILVSLRISRPIVSLAKTMRTMHISDFQVKPVQSNDEIGLLEHGYNSMMQRIKELIEDEYQKNIELKNAQLVALQAQINPHFLNNTLHMIGGMALSKNAPEIYQITRTIGELLRYSISTEGDMVLLKDELNHMKNYIFIQEHRFAGRCTIDFSVDEAVLESRLPKFTLQPIVENAFEHGLQKKEGKWSVEIRIKPIGNSRIGIIVMDNGIGIDEELLNQVRMELRNGLSIMTDRTGTAGPKKRKGIGLRNVNARLKLHFGDRYRAQIFSKPGVGTIVVLKVPLIKGEG
jgi:Predicted signal transduction protein with a C-terminal ATPase domain